MPLEPFENAGNFREDVGMFEAATQATPIRISKPALRTIHLALDGSNQDATARGLAMAIADRSGAAVNEQAGAIDAAEIVRSVQSHAADLLVIPAPFGRDYNVLGDHSLGSVVDMLLLDCPCPIICIRSPMDLDQVSRALTDVVVPIAISHPSVSNALSWAFRLMDPGGCLELLAVADREVLDEAQRFLQTSTQMDAFGVDQLERALMRDIGGIVSATQKFAGVERRNVHVETRVGKFIQTVTQRARAHDCLLVWGAPRDHNSPAFHRAVDLILVATGPVLVVVSP